MTAGESDCEDQPCVDGSAKMLLGQDSPRRATSATASCHARLAAGLLAVLGVVIVVTFKGDGARPLPANEHEPISRFFEATKFAPPPSDDRERCGEMEEDMDYQGLPVATVYNVGSAHMCCSACAAYDNCSTWTWGKKRGEEFLTDVCWLSKPSSEDGPKKTAKEGVVAGFRAKEVHKHGVKPPPISTAEKSDGVAGSGESAHGTEKCPGVVKIDGHGEVSLVSAGANVPGEPAAETEVLSETLVVPHMGARVYFADDGCEEGDYSPDVYSAINFLGKKISWTTDVSGTNCGCNAAFYLVSMKQNEEIGTCNDFYCDAQSVCGVPCGEIDLMEANMFVWMSTLHTHNPEDGPDGVGVGPGYGGSLGVPPRRDWTSERYGPGSACVDTTKPFQVSVSFPTDASGTLTDMKVELSQGDCTVAGGSPPYQLDGRRPMDELTKLLKEGMTPVISYWNSEDMLWFDGLAVDGLGACVRDDPSVCPDWVRFWDITIEGL